MSKKILSCFMALILTTSLTSCGINAQKSSATNTSDQTTSDSTVSPTKNTTEETTVTLSQDILDNMSLDEKIGQLFIIRPDALDSDLSNEQIDNPDKYGVTSINGRMEQTLKDYPVGGVCLFSKNITTPNKTVALINSLQSSCKTGLFVGIDEEGGRISRLANDGDFNVKKYDNMESIGNTGDFSQAEDVGRTIGTYLQKYNFNLDFAPDCDVNTNPDNVVIGDRAFGSNPNEVADMVSAAINGFHQSNTICCVKHFPGHGDTKDDTHSGFVAATKTWNEMKDCEIIPFKSAIEANTDMIMVAHITAENVTTDNLPASMSKQIITDKLKGELGFDGIVITDSMAMGAITKNYSSKDSAIMAINAGADIVLMPEDYKKAFNGVKDAVGSGEISEERINESVLKIINLKLKYCIIENQ